VALYRETCITPPQGQRVDGLAWSAPGPGATIRGWSSPRRSPSAWFTRMDRLAADLDQVYAGLTAGEKASWNALQVARPELCVCAEDRKGLFDYELHLYAQSATCFITSPWGKCCQATPQVVGLWGHLTWAVYGGGWWYVVGKLYNLADFADWTNYHVYYATLLTVTVYASVGGALSVNGHRVEVGASRDVDYMAEPPPCRIHRG